MSLLQRSEHRFEHAPFTAQDGQGVRDALHLGGEARPLNPWLSMRQAALYIPTVRTANGAIRWCKRNGVILRGGGKGWVVSRAEVDRALLRHGSSVRRTA